ncbi:hypothetical protein KIPB_000699 [Kipferlia bialata]|uniref:OTU domain-containing protein n=1 Tax=Kipferlia bialata TaxID=797122 RepID=A0A9K3CNV1_9EUKA|nr:hypothetical protein KIPB_000699 [Kipferlia bialata]|eukprot:g699.t1
MTEPTPKYRLDYTPPTHDVECVSLSFVIKDGTTRVTSEAVYVTRGEEATPLYLDGEALTLVSISMDGIPLAEGEGYTLQEEGLTVTQTRGSAGASGLYTHSGLVVWLILPLTLGDGHCLFRGLAMSLKSTVRELREECSSAIESDFLRMYTGADSVSRVFFPGRYADCLMRGYNTASEPDWVPNIHCMVHEAQRELRAENVVSDASLGGEEEIGYLSHLHGITTHVVSLRQCPIEGCTVTSSVYSATQQQDVEDYKKYPSHACVLVHWSQGEDCHYDMATLRGRVSMTPREAAGVAEWLQGALMTQTGGWAQAPWDR